MKLAVILLILATTYAYTIVPTLDIDLDGPAKQRFQPAVQLVLNTYGYDASFGAFFSYHNETTFKHLTSKDYAILATSVRTYWPQYAQELEGIVEAFNRSDVTFEYMAAWAYFHEIGHSLSVNIKECTAILLQTKDGIIHGRNMDQSPDAGRLLVIHFKFIKNGQYIGESVDQYWFKTGFVTMFKYGVVSLQENWRYGHYLPLFMLLKKISAGTTSLGWTFRHILDSDINNFDQAVTYLENVIVACSQYNIVAGTKFNQGAIISRDPISTFPTLFFNNTGLGNDQFQYMVQTNYDHWHKDPKGDQRRTIAQNLLANLTSTMQNELGVYSVINTYPIHNEGTFYTAIMNVATGRFNYFGQEGITPFNDLE
ncbi:unnamed protein product (macronuclear) [Paramecium tetraurelia]|uniref:ceramidase n=1 Tax=Paramecium tetraurelia TaxID=5888 RepID=A0C778_PARTE|nr:uncharacterized protein GSPATT00035775001 [Paramecium tetraurelia]CAK66645.1 unnamed protein product [Paramecium tetraurelia]|eukprot:XP_001434042.1 hypothetical protein (macronuclear) [Paramecium tetraurelia strain d4-2]